MATPTPDHAPEGLPLPEYVTINRACEWLAVSRRTLYNWMHTGKVQYVRTPGGCRRILRSSLLRQEP